jgi:hypothetical protein
MPADRNDDLDPPSIDGFDLDRFGSAVDAEDYQAELDRQGLRGDGVVHLITTAGRLGWTVGEVHRWAMERDLLEVVDEHGRRGLGFRCPWQVFDDLVRSVYLERLPPLEWSEEDGERIVRFPSIDGVEGESLGFIYRVVDGEEPEEVGEAVGEVRVGGSERLGLLAAKLGVFGDPLRGAPPDLFHSVHVLGPFHPFDDRDVWAMRHLTGLGELDLGLGRLGIFLVGGVIAHPITNASLGVIASFERLTSLGLRSRDVTDAGLGQLGGLSLEDFGFGFGPITGAGLGAIVGPSTRELHLEFTSEPVGALSWLPRATSLRRLVLRQVGLDERHLAGMEGLRLEYVELTGHSSEGRSRPGRVGDETARMIARIPTVKVVRLGGTDVGNRGVGHLTGLPLLEELYVGNTAVDDAVTGVLAGAPRLRVLDLSYNPIGDAGVKRLRRLPLRALHLFDTAVTDRSVKFLTQMPTLEEIDLSETAVTPRGLSRLRKLPRLRWLGAYHLEQPDLELVQSELPGVKIANASFL